jgi:hypothetical protein
LRSSRKSRRHQALSGLFCGVPCPTASVDVHDEIADRFFGDEKRIFRRKRSVTFVNGRQEFVAAPLSLHPEGKSFSYCRLRGANAACFNSAAN